MQYDQLISDLEELLKENSRCIIGIDGRCAGGKTTLSNLLAGQFPARVFHMDDFYLSIWNHKWKWEKVNTVGNVLLSYVSGLESFPA